MGPPWGHHNDYSSSSNAYYPSSQPDGSSYSTPVVPGPGPTTPPPGPWHHQWTTSSSSRWPSMASDNRSTSLLPSKTPLAVEPPHPQKDLTDGALAAAVVVPILAVFSAIGLIFLCLRRRRQNPPPANAPPLATVGIKEKFGSFRRRRDPPPPPPPAMSEPPVLTSQHNNAYLTGLDTSSIGSREDSGEYQVRASYEPPPPYIHEPSPPSVDARARSPFEDPPEHRAGANDVYLAALNRSGVPRSASNVSVSSTLYSDNASVHEAREARRSMAGAQLVEAMSTTGEEGNRRLSDPFVSPVSSPVSPVDVDGDEHRRASNISEMDRR